MCAFFLPICLGLRTYVEIGAIDPMAFHSSTHHDRDGPRFHSDREGEEIFWGVMSHGNVILTGETLSFILAITISHADLVDSTNRFR